MRRSIIYLVLMCIFASFVSTELVYSQSDQVALQKTLSLLLNPAARAKIAKESPDAAKAINQVNTVSPDPKHREIMFKLSAEIFKDLEKKSGGDPNKMLEHVQKASQNPKKFFESLSPSTRSKIKKLAVDIEKSQSAKP